MGSQDQPLAAICRCGEYETCEVCLDAHRRMRERNTTNVACGFLSRGHHPSTACLLPKAPGSERCEKHKEARTPEQVVDQTTRNWEAAKDTARPMRADQIRNARFEDLDKRLGRLEKRLGHLTSELANTTRCRDEWQKLYEKAEAVIEEKDEQIGHLHDRLNDAEERIQGFVEASTDCVRQNMKLEAKVQKLKAKLRKAKAK